MNKSEQALKAIGAIVLIFITILFTVIAGSLFGALAAIIVGWVYPSVLTKLTIFFGFHAFYQTGALLGFVGGFFRSSTTINNKS